MTVGSWLKGSEQRLRLTGLGSAHLDALILLEDVLAKDRGWLLAHPEEKLPSSLISKLANKLEKRANHEPLAYIRGRVEFYGRTFLVNSDVLVPRPESETMIELLLNQVESKKLKVKRIVDVGTGSGALAVTAKLEIPEARVIATDIDPKCLKIAKKNAQKYNAKVKFVQGNLLEPLTTSPWPLSTILANLPYVPDRFPINRAAKHEPKLAIFGGKDGLDVYRQFWQQSSRLGPHLIFTESLPPSHDEMSKLAKSAGYKLIKTQGFIQIFKLAP